MTSAKQSLTGTIDASGNATIRFRPTRGQNWIIGQVSVSAPNVGAGALCSFFVNSDNLGPLVPTGDAASGDPPVPVHNNETFSVQWTGGTVGAQVNAIILYDDGN
jgi:hypothetical protein